MKKRLIIAILALLLFAGTMPQKAYALTYEQTTTAQPKRIWDYLYAQLGNAYGVAGIMGNMYVESGLRPNNLDNVANGVFGMSDEEFTNAVDDGSYTTFGTTHFYYGLNQWGGGRKQRLYDYAKSIDASVGSLEAQLGFVMQELNTGYFSGLKRTIMNATSLREASDEWLRVYGGVTKDEASKAYRASFGQQYLEAYAPDVAAQSQPPQDPPESDVSGNTPAENTAGNTDPGTSSGNTSPNTPTDNTSPNTPADNTTQNTPSDAPAPNTPTENTSPSTPSGNTAPNAPADNTAPNTPEGNTDNHSGAAAQDPEPPAPVKSSDATLKSLSISSGYLYPRFSPSVNSYSAVVENSVTRVNVSAAASHSAASVSVSGGRDLSVGKNTVTVQVTAEDGSRNTYRITVERKDVPGTAYEDLPDVEEIAGNLEPDMPAGADSPAVDETQTFVLPEYVQKPDEGLFGLPVPNYVIGSGAAVLVLLLLIILL